MRDVFEVQHRQLIELAQAILTVVHVKPAAATEELNRLRLALSRAITNHCKEEADILNSTDGLPDRVVRRYHDELLQWRRDLIICNSAWPPQRVWESPRGFAAAFRPIVTALKHRIEWERKELYPVLPKAA